MKELFEVLLRLRCTEIHLTLDSYSVTFIHDDDVHVTLSHPNVKGLTDTINKFIKE